MLPADINKRFTIAAYIKEALGYLKQIDALNLKIQGVVDSVKDAKDYLEISPKEFNKRLKAAHDFEKAQTVAKESAEVIEDLEILGFGENTMFSQVGIIGLEFDEVMQ